MTEKWNDRLFMTRSQMREYDRITIEKYGIPSAVLMENAGRGTAALILSLRQSKAPISVFTGPGNNGGDGFVIARHLINAGCEVKTCLAAPPDRLQGDALRNYLTLKEMSARIVDLTVTGIAALAEALKDDGIVVDALFGTGVERALDPIMVKVIEVINACPATVVSADIPSGLDADTGATWGHVVAADITATYGHIKRGMLLFPGATSCGRIEVIPIGAPAKVSEEAGADGLILCNDYVQPFLPSRRLDAHKGTCGHLAVVAGSMGKSGAAVMTGQAALRTGAGLVTIATTQNARPTVESRCLELMVETVIEKVDAALTDKSVKNAVALMEGKTAVALGPGLTTAPGISALAVRLLQSLEIPAVVDADGINILAADPSGAGRITTPMVLTPHPGEMARLMGKSVAQVQADRIGAAREAARWHKVVIVLKGAHSIIASPEGDIWMNPTGNPGMATAGMGDVQTGIIGGLLAQGVEPLQAALLGTYLHGLTADRRCARTGNMGLIAGDVIDELPSVLREWECAARGE